MYEPLQGLLVVGSLQGVEDGGPHQEVREGHDHQGEGLNLKFEF